jgi:hypothetical protein
MFITVFTKPATGPYPESLTIELNKGRGSIFGSLYSLSLSRNFSSYIEAISHYVGEAFSSEADCRYLATYLAIYYYGTQGLLQ